MLSSIEAEVTGMSVETKSLAEGRECVANQVRIRPGEFSRRVDVSDQQVYRWIYAGKLKATLVGRAWFIPVSELEDFFEREAEVA
jgi:excisionase family DNA binding protein